MKYSSKEELKETILYEREKWLKANGLSTSDKVRGVREISYVRSLRNVEYYLQFPKWQRPFRGGYPTYTTA